MIENGLPTFGTCAGMIMLAKHIEGEESHLGLMDISVKRNAYGKQINSFKAETIIEKISSNPIPLVFIRAPWVESVEDNVEVLCEYDGHITAVKQGRMLATAFHPELTDDLTIHKYFLDMIH